MLSNRLRIAAVRAAAVAALGFAVTACATPNYDEQFGMINNRLDTMSGQMVSLDARVQEAITRADAAGQAASAASAEARAANQRVDQLQMQRMAPRSPRG